MKGRGSRRRSASTTRKKKRAPSSPPAAATASTSIAAFGRLVNVDEKAVRKGIATGRIPASCIGLSSTGRKQVIVDVAGARLAWDQNAAKLPNGPDVGAGRASLVEASTLNAMERHRKLKIDNDLKAGLVVDVRAATREAFERTRIIRETLLNLPNRIAAELAAETDPARVFARLDDAIREALSETADRLEAAGE